MKKGYKEELYSISNTLLLNIQNVNSYSLFEGKLGIAIYYYNFASCYNNELYHQYANDIIKDLFANLKANKFDLLDSIEMSIGVSYLIKKKYIANDFKVMISNIHKSLLLINSNYLYRNHRKLTYIGVFLLKIIRKNSSTKEALINKVLAVYESMHYASHLPENYIDFLLYFLTNVGQVEKHKQKADSIIHRIRVEYFKLNHLKNINYDNFCLMTNIKTDFYIKESAKNGLYDSANHIKNNEEDLVNRFVKKNIYNLLFDIEASNGKIPINISSIVRDKQQILIEKNITLNDGLAGIGLAMLHHVDAK